MRGSAALRASVAPGGALAGPWVRDELWRRARAVPSLDLRFAENKSLVDATTGAQLVTFTRASSGTYTDSQGVIRQATTNLLLRSEEFQTTWGATLSTVSTDTTTAPNGAATADSLIVNNTQTIINAYISQDVTKPAAALTYSVSVYAKANQYNRITVTCHDTATLNNRALATVDLSNGTFVTSPSAVGTFSNAAGGTIVDAGNGWYRIGFTFTTSTETGIRTRLSARDSSATTGDGTSGIYLWGAQLEQSSTVGEYVPTGATINSAPRFDHNPVTGESLGLLVEEQRTNSLVRSEEFETTWTAAGLSSITADAATAPNGAATADTLVETTGVSEVHRVVQNASITSGSSYTVSAFAKQAQRRYCYLIFTPNSTWNGTSTIAYFDLQTGTIVNTANCTATITAFPNGWYRLTATATATATNAAAPIGIGSSSTGTVQTYTGDGSNAITVWGAQLEAGAFPTSYIPTGASAVTRAADVASISDGPSGSNFSGWYDATQGTLYAEGAVPSGTSSARALAGIDDGTNNERILFGHNGTTAIQNLIVDGGVIQVNTTVTANSFPVNTYRKLAFAFRENDFAAIIAPDTVETDTSGTLPTPTQLQIGNAPGRSQPCLPIKRLTYWPARLPNNVLQTLTQ
jgi:hypothetical protein